MAPQPAPGSPSLRARPAVPATFMGSGAAVHPGIGLAPRWLGERTIHVGYTISKSPCRSPRESTQGGVSCTLGAWRASRHSEQEASFCPNNGINGISLTCLSGSTGFHGGTAVLSGVWRTSPLHALIERVLSPWQGAPRCSSMGRASEPGPSLDLLRRTERTPPFPKCSEAGRPSAPRSQAGAFFSNSGLASDRGRLGPGEGWRRRGDAPRCRHRLTEHQQPLLLSSFTAVLATEAGD